MTTGARGDTLNCATEDARDLVVELAALGGLVLPPARTDDDDATSSRPNKTGAGLAP